MVVRHVEFFFFKLDEIFICDVLLMKLERFPSR